jgi:hypothetical protein
LAVFAALHQAGDVPLLGGEVGAPAGLEVTGGHLAAAGTRT